MSIEIELDDADLEAINESIEEIQETRNELLGINQKYQQLKKQKEKLNNKGNQLRGQLQSQMKSTKRLVEMLKKQYDAQGMEFDPEAGEFVEELEDDNNLPDDMDVPSQFTQGVE